MNLCISKDEYTFYSYRVFCVLQPLCEMCQAAN